MKKILMLAVLVLAGVGARGEIIEGMKPNGDFQAVGLDSNGDFLVAVATGIPQHVISDIGSVTSITGTVSLSSGTSINVVYSSVPISVTVSPSSTFTVTAAKATVFTSSAWTPGPSSGPLTILAANALRDQSVIQNNDPSIVVYVGPVGVTTGTGFPIQPAGGFLSPDVPASFTGVLVAVSTADVATGSLNVFTITP